LNPYRHSRRMFLGKIARTIAGIGVGIPSLDTSLFMVAAQGQFELFRTNHDFDGTYHNPRWLG